MKELRSTAPWPEERNLTLEALEEALEPFKRFRSYKRFRDTIAEAPAVEVRTTVHVEKGMLMALNPHAKPLFPALMRGDEPVYVTCHPDQEVLVRGLVAAIRGAR